MEQIKVTPALSVDAEAASVYSCASAPADYHDHIFRTQPFALDPTAPPAAPRWVMPQEPPRVIVQAPARGPASVLQSLSPISAHHYQSDHEPETVTQLLEQIEELNQTSTSPNASSITLHSPP